MSATVSDNLIRSLFERWERLEEEKRNISDDLKELFAEARGQGLDTKALRAVFREQVGDKDALQEFDAICDLYRASLNSPRAGRTREASSHGEDFVPLHRVSTQEPGRQNRGTLFPFGRPSPRRARGRAPSPPCHYLGRNFR